MRYCCYILFVFLSAGFSFAQVKQLYVPVADSKVYVEVHGKGQPVLFLHAGNMDHRMWGDQVSALEKSYRVILMDLRGCGQTEDGDSTY